jgi:ABC-type transport system involved in multi-copper enzyme maturation permease subunit
MIWMTWRQFRASAVVAAAALIVLAVALLATRPHLASLYNTSGLPTCRTGQECSTLANDFLRELRTSPALSVVYFGGIIVMFVAPGVLGVFWGAPLITREIEAGTYRLAWNQSVTRTRWLATKLGLLGAAAMAAAGLLSLMLTWWGSPIERVAPFDSEAITNRLMPVLFAAHGITPVGYAAFAFALGVTLGVIIRRTVPAMGATLAIFAFAQVAFPLWIRPHLISPLRSSTALSATKIIGVQMQKSGGPVTVIGSSATSPSAWILSSQTTTASGHAFTGPPPAACGQASGFAPCANALGKLHLRELVTYQPATRYWAFQWYETGIFLVLALLLAGLCFWWTRRRLS